MATPGRSQQTFGQTHRGLLVPNVKITDMTK